MQLVSCSALARTCFFGKLSASGAAQSILGLAARRSPLRALCSASDAAASTAEEDVRKPTPSYGAQFLERARFEKRQGQGGARQQSAPAADLGADREEQTREQLRRLWKDLPGHASPTFAFSLHKRGQLEPKIPQPLLRERFEEVYADERHKFFQTRTREVGKRRRTRRNYMQLNTGYTEEEEVYEAEINQFDGGHRTASIAEDRWKAEYYQDVKRVVDESVPDRSGGPLAGRGSDRLADIFAGALRSHVSDQSRPVLTHELSDYENAYMMKRSALQRILQERCMGNQLDESVLPRLLDNRADLAKLRATAALPPEVVEPLAAFRGDVRWHFDVRERLSQKLVAAETALDAIETGDASDHGAVVSELPENTQPPVENAGIRHPWRNHVGFESANPTGVAGGTNFGRPQKALEERLGQLRYPTLQRVAHTLPKERKWRAHVVRSIEVLERSKYWDFQSKLNAINTMKEVYDNLAFGSERYNEQLSEKLPVNRVPGHLWRKYAPGVQYVKTYPRQFLKRKTFTKYSPSLTTRNELWLKMRQG